MSGQQDDPTGDGGGAEAGQQAYRTGPGIGDIFSIPETVNEMKVGLALNVLVAIGIAFVSLGVSTASMGALGGFGGSGGASALATMIPLVLAPLVGAVLGLRQADVLDDQPGNVLYANAIVTTVVGTFLLMLIAMILGLVIAGAGNLGQAISNAILPFVIAAIGAGIVAAGAVWVENNVLPGASRQPAPQTG